MIELDKVCTKPQALTFYQLLFKGKDYVRLVNNHCFISLVSVLHLFL